MRVTTDNNRDAKRHITELLEVCCDMLGWSGESAFIDETRYFYANIRARLKADVDYLAANLRRGELPVWGFEPFADGVDAWAN